MQGGKRMAVLAGCNYPHWGRPNALEGCINDVVCMKKVLISRFGFKEEDIELLTDDEQPSKNKSTGANIKKALERMVNNAADGDLLVFHFSGHGTSIDDKVDPSKKHQAIIPCDFHNYGDYITDVYFHKLVSGIRHKAFFTMLADSCNSGGLIGEEKEQIGPAAISSSKAETNSFKRKFVSMESILAEFNQDPRRPTLNMGDFVKLYFRDVDYSLIFNLFNGKFNIGFNISKGYDNGILLSGCQSNEYAVVDPNVNPPCGAFTYAVMTVLDKSGPISYRQLVMQTRKFLEDQRPNINQHPCLYCSDENADATFLLERQVTTN